MHNTLDHIYIYIYSHGAKIHYAQTELDACMHECVCS